MAVTDRVTQTQQPRAAFWLFALTLALLPIGLGGNRPLPLGLAQITFAVSALYLCRAPVALFLPRQIKIMLGLLGAVLVWAALQLLPIAPDFLAHPLWHETQTALGHDIGASIAIAPEAGWNGWLRLCTAIAAGFLSYIFAQDKEHARKLLHMLWVAGCAICAYGLIATGSGTETILWLSKTDYFDDLTATFINRNHFAIYAGMIFVIGLALMLHSARQKFANASKTQMRALLQQWLGREGLGYGLALALIFASIALSHSRAGLALTLLGSGLYIVLQEIYRKNFRRALWLAGGGVVLAGLALLLAMSLSDRFALLLNDYSARDRMNTYGIMMRAMGDNPLLGTGLNGFQSVWRQYQHDMVMEFNRGHSDILESLLDLGLPFGLMLWGAIALALAGLWRGVTQRRRDGLFPCLALACALMVLAHALIDFSLQIPAITLTFSALTGMGLAQSWGSTDKIATDA